MLTGKSMERDNDSQAAKGDEAIMKIKEGYLLRETATAYLVVPVGERVIEFKEMMTLNNTGAFIWKQLQTGKSFEALLASLLSHYAVEEAAAKADLEVFLQELRDNGLLEE